MCVCVYLCVCVCAFLCVNVCVCYCWYRYIYISQKFRWKPSNVSHYFRNIVQNRPETPKNAHTRGRSNTFFSLMTITIISKYSYKISRACPKMRAKETQNGFQYRDKCCKKVFLSEITLWVILRTPVKYDVKQLNGFQKIEEHQNVIIHENQQKITHNLIKITSPGEGLKVWVTGMKTIWWIWTTSIIHFQGFCKVFKQIFALL